MVSEPPTPFTAAVFDPPVWGLKDLFGAIGQQWLEEHHSRG